MYARQILKKISEKVVVMINKDGGGGILEFVGVTTVMRGHIAPSPPNWGKPVSICEFKYKRVKIFVGLDPLIHILIRMNVFTKTKSNYDQFNLYNIKIL